jgi:hypothetical protein
MHSIKLTGIPSDNFLSAYAWLYVGGAIKHHLIKRRIRIIYLFEIFNEVLNTALFIGGIITFSSALIVGYSGLGGGLLIIPLLAIPNTPIEGIAINYMSSNFATKVQRVNVIITVGV